MDHMFLFWGKERKRQKERGIERERERNRQRGPLKNKIYSHTVVEVPRMLTVCNTS
jgi:hypothetical protein